MSIKFEVGKVYKESQPRINQSYFPLYTVVKRNDETNRITIQSYNPKTGEGYGKKITRKIRSGWDYSEKCASEMIDLGYGCLMADFTA